jgi:hypothetical protein
MRWLSVCAVAAVAAAGLGGCGGEKDKTVAAVPKPVRKAGLWEETTTVPGAPMAPQVLRLCTDPSVEATLPWWGGVAQAGGCTEVSGKHNPDGTWSFESRCDLGAAGKTGITGVGSGDFNSRYEVKIRTVTAGAAEPKMNGPQQLTNVFEWKGQCPADWSPGDVEVPGGLRMNRDPGTVAREIEKAKAALKQQDAESKAQAKAEAAAGLPPSK